MVITAFEQVTAEWLTEVLHRSGHLKRGQVTEVQLEKSASNTAAVAHLSLSYSNDAPESAPRALFLKLSDRRREVDFYNLIVPYMTDPPVLRCYDAVYSAEQVRSHMLLEDLKAIHLPPEDALPPSTLRYERLIDALAGIHAQWWEHERLHGEIGEMAGQVKDYVIRVSQDAFAGFADFLGDRLSPEQRAIYETVFARWPPRNRAERLKTGDGLTIIHGDAHAWNFLSPRDPMQDRVRIIDWAMWQVGTGTDDLAYMIAMHDFPGYRARMERPLLKRYCERLAEHGVEGYTWEQCWLDYRTSAISNLFWPVFHWSVKGEPRLWWPNLERSLMAFQDLRCDDLLDE